MIKNDSFFQLCTAARDAGRAAAAAQSNAAAALRDLTAHFEPDPLAAGMERLVSAAQESSRLLAAAAEQSHAALSGPLSKLLKEDFKQMRDTKG